MAKKLYFSTILRTLCKVSVDWIDTVYLFDQGSSSDISCTYKLTSAYIKPNTFQKIYVKLAAQVLSNSVASAMFALYSSVLHLEQWAILKQPFSATAGQISFLAEDEQFLNALKVHDHLGRAITNSFNFIKSLAPQH
ncbi:unnamed protein product [Ceratitis capitata]|uniref:(Mediterranean fruit fly) hypothetical protein n=1 Tax=Ceratitis capitata TaxID=7213 RepID=A0A811US08_CERCA|nr:unnamed protein product [Ceratitis capitata]